MNRKREIESELNELGFEFTKQLDALGKPSIPVNFFEEKKREMQFLIAEKKRVNKIILYSITSVLAAACTALVVYLNFNTDYIQYPEEQIGYEELMMLNAVDEFELAAYYEEYEEVSANDAEQILLKENNIEELINF